MEVFSWGADGGHVILVTRRQALLDGTGINLLMEKMPQASEALNHLAAHLPLSTFIPLVQWTNMGQIYSLIHSQRQLTTETGCFVSDYAGLIAVPLARRGPGLPRQRAKRWSSGFGRI